MKVHVLAIAAVAATSVAAVALPQMAAAGHSTVHASTRLSLLIDDAHAQTKQVDTAPKGDGPGDVNIVAAPLSIGGRAAGRSEEICTLTDAKYQGFHCSGSFILRGGSIEWAGAAVSGTVPGVGKSTLGQGIKLAIVGGTGRYAGARGALLGVTLPHQRERDTLTFSR